MIERPDGAGGEDDDPMEVVIVRNSDGAQVVQRPSWKPCYTWADEFWWTEGNMGCDCNRRLCFARAAGEPDCEMTCGHTEFSVILMVPA